MIIRSMDAKPACGADEQEQIVSGAVRPFDSEILVVLMIISAFVKLHNRYLSVCSCITIQNCIRHLKLLFCLNAFLHGSE